MINGVISALLGCVIFAAIIVINRSYVAEVRGLLAGRGTPAQASGEKDES